MAIIFYPQEDELEASTLEQKLEVLMESAERYKAVMLEITKSAQEGEEKKMMTPRELRHAYNWEELAIILREIRELPEASPSAKINKSDKLIKLAAIYEVLRGAKMPKLEAVRLALMNEAAQIRPGTASPV